MPNPIIKTSFVDEYLGQKQATKKLSTSAVDEYLKKKEEGESVSSTSAYPYQGMGGTSVSPSRETPTVPALTLDQFAQRKNDLQTQYKNDLTNLQITRPKPVGYNAVSDKLDFDILDLTSKIEASKPIEDKSFLTHTGGTVNSLYKHFANTFRGAGNVLEDADAALGGVPGYLVSKLFSAYSPIHKLKSGLQENYIREKDENKKKELGLLIQGLEGTSNPLYGLADWYETAADDFREMPDTFVGATLDGLMGVVPLVLELSVTPEVRVARFASTAPGVVGKAVNIPKLATLEGMKGLYRGTKTGDNTKDRLKSGLVGAVEGFTAGSVLHSLGVGSGMLGNLVGQATKSAVLSGSAASLANGIGFMGYDVYNQYTQNGEVDWGTAAESLGVGIGLGLPGVPRLIGTDVKRAVIRNAYNKAAKNFMSASPKAIDLVQSMDIEPSKLRERSIELGDQAAQETNIQRKNELLSSKTLIDNIIDINAISKDVIVNPDLYRKSIQESDLPDATKKTQLDKIDKIIENNKKIQDDVDVRILDNRKEFQEPELFINEETRRTINDIDGELPVINDRIRKASDNLYEEYKRLESSKLSQTRKNTIEEIETAQKFLEKEISDLENLWQEQAKSDMFKKRSDVTAKPVIGVSEKTPSTNSIKKILKAGENTFTRKITKDGEEFGEITIEEKPEGWEVKRVDVNEEGRGFGKQVYRSLNEEAGQQGDVIKSDRPDKISSKARNMWDSLVRSEEAEKMEDGSYRMKPSANFKAKPEPVKEEVSAAVEVQPEAKVARPIKREAKAPKAEAAKEATPKVEAAKPKEETPKVEPPKAEPTPKTERADFAVGDKVKDKERGFSGVVQEVNPNGDLVVRSNEGVIAQYKDTSSSLELSKRDLVRDGVAEVKAKTEPVAEKPKPVMPEKKEVTKKEPPKNKIKPIEKKAEPKPKAIEKPKEKIKQAAEPIKEEPKETSTNPKVSDGERQYELIEGNKAGEYVVDEYFEGRGAAEQARRKLQTTNPEYSWKYEAMDYGGARTHTVSAKLKTPKAEPIKKAKGYTDLTDISREKNKGTEKPKNKIKPVEKVKQTYTDLTDLGVAEKPKIKQGVKTEAPKNKIKPTEKIKQGGITDLTKLKVNDNKNKTGIPSEKRVGEKLKQTKPDKTTSSKKTETSGNVQEKRKVVDRDIKLSTRPRMNAKGDVVGVEHYIEAGDKTYRVVESRGTWYAVNPSDPKTISAGKPFGKGAEGEKAAKAYLIRKATGIDVEAVEKKTAEKTVIPPSPKGGTALPPGMSGEQYRQWKEAQKTPEGRNKTAAEWMKDRFKEEEDKQRSKPAGAGFWDNAFNAFRTGKEKFKEKNISEGLKYWWKSYGGIPKSSARIIRSTKNAIEAVKYDTVNLLKNMTKELEGRLSDQDKKMINSAMKQFADIGDTRVIGEMIDRFETLLSDSFKEDLLQARALMDSHSRRIAQLQMINTPLAEAITARQGFYMTRTYKVHTDRRYTWENIPAAVKDAALPIFMEYNPYKSIFNQSSDLLKNPKEEWMKKNKQDAIVEAYKDGRLLDAVNDGRITASDFIDLVVSAEKANKGNFGIPEEVYNKRIKEQAEHADIATGMMKQMVEVGDIADFVLRSGPRMLDADVRSLKRRSEFLTDNPEVRELLGENTDPFYNIATTLFRQTELLAKGKMYEAIKDDLLAQGLISEHQSASKNHIAQIKLNYQFSGKPGTKALSEYYTTPEIAKNFNDLLQPKSESSLAMKLWLGSMSAAKISKTALSVKGTVRNFKSNLMNVVANGNFNTISTAKEIANQLKDRNGFTRELISRGIIGDSTNVGDIMRNIEDMSSKNSIFRVGDETLGEKIKRKTVMPALKTYAWADDVWKVYRYVSEYLRYGDVYKKMGMNDVDAIEMAKTKASDILHDTSTYYSELPRIIQLARKTPWSQTFISFPYSTMVNFLKGTELGWKEIKDPYTRNIGMQRLSGHLASIVALSAVSAYRNRKNGQSAEDVEGWKRYLPDYWKNDIITITEDHGNGTATYVNNSYMDYYGSITTPLLMVGRKAALGTLQTEDLINAAKEFVGKFVGYEMTFKAYVDLIKNSNDNGYAIYNEEDTWSNKFKDITWYLAENLYLPATITDLMKVNETRKEGGDWGHALLAMGKGAQSRKIDPVRSMQSYIFPNYKKRIESARDIYSEVLRGYNRYIAPNNMEKDQLANAKFEAEESLNNVINSIREDYYEAIRLGNKPADVSAALKNARFDADIREAIFSNRKVKLNDKGQIILGDRVE
jgi:hypothetical protein